MSLSCVTDVAQSLGPPISLLTIAEMSLADKLSMHDWPWTLHTEALGHMPQLISSRRRCMESPIVRFPFCLG